MSLRELRSYNKSVYLPAKADLEEFDLSMRTRDILNTIMLTYLKKDYSMFDILVAIDYITEPSSDESDSSEVRWAS